MWPDCAKNSDGLALLRAAVANRNERTPRSVMADWLQEHNEDEVAQVMRESLQNQTWEPFPQEIWKKWAPWNVCYDGWRVAVEPNAMYGRSAKPRPANRKAWWMRLAASPWLPGLALSERSDTDADLNALLAHSNLTTLSLMGSNLTDRGLDTLALLKNVTYPDLRN